MINNNFFYTDQMYSQRQLPGMAYIRLFHAAPGAPEVDIYANGRKVANRLAYGQFTDYISLAEGTYTIEAFPVGLTVSPVLSVTLPIGSRIYTLALIGILPRIGILPIVDEFAATTAGRANIRFANLSPNAPSLNLALRGGSNLITDISYTEVSGYIPIRPGNYNFVVTPASSSTIVTDVPRVRILPSRNLTFYVLGLYGQQPSSLEVYIPLDGSTYLRDY
ncbi:MAG: DUF4397 domain-containing protein [Ruminiclostridium sp.]